MALFSTSSASNDQLTAATPQLLTPQETLEIGGITASSFGAHDAKSTRRLRSIVERRFRRMFDAHDRIRTELLASHLPHTK
jgi:hypothetical protein